jgi:cytochrome c biogenesis protein CcmG/thiol:disulfide interchange protein DsbE
MIKGEMMKFARFSLLLLLAAGCFAFAAEKTEYEQASNFTLPDVKGAAVELDSLLKAGPVYMECWDLPCVNCIAELDALMPVYDSLKERGLQIVALSVDKPADEARVKAFVKSKKWPYICLLDAQNEVKKAYGIVIKPTAYLINMKGEIVYTHIGYKKGDENKIADEFLKWLPEQPVEETPAEEDK